MRALVSIYIVLFTLVANAAIKVNITPSNPHSEDIISISYTYEGRKDRGNPDFTPLEKDFEIISTAKRSSVSIVNGAVEAKTQWRVSIQAKRAGKFSLPPIRFGNESSKEQALTIGKGEKQTNSKAKNVFLKTEVSQLSPYVSEQILYKIKLFYQSTLTSGRLTHTPNIPNTSIMKIGEVKEYQTRVNNKLYQVNEQTYALFPQKTGKLVIQSPVFEGAVSRSHYSNMNQLLLDMNKPIRLRGETQTLTVKPIPASFTGTHWLPAKSVSLNEEWAQGDSLKVGEPITRHITLSAEGVTAEELPPLIFKNIPELKVYPDKPSLSNQRVGETIIGKKTIKVIYIPTSESITELPAVTIPWWNTKTNKQEVASITKRTLMVQGASPKTGPPPVSPAPISQIKDKSALVKTEETSSFTLPWLLVALLSLSWIVFFANKFRRILVSSPTNSKDTPPSSRQLKKALSKACHENDLNACRDQLIALAKYHYQTETIRNLQDIVKLAKTKQLAETINQLEKTLYGGRSKFSTSSLLDAWQHEISTMKQKPKKGEEPLPVFNP